MGLDTDRFISDVNDALTCGICRDVLEDPVQAPCEHAYCKTCIEGWLVHETICPECRQPLSVSSLRVLFRYMRNDLNRLRLRCRNQAYGCDVISDLEFMANHEAECPHERLKCPNERCTYFNSRQDMAKHVKTCEFSRKQCSNGCGMIISEPIDEHHNCIQELRTAIEVLRSEVMCKYEDQKKEMDLRLDMQRGHMIQKEAILQSQVDDLKSENSKLMQHVKLLMDMELTRRQEIEKLELEKKELMELLRNNARGESRPSGSGNRPKRVPTLLDKVTTV